MLKNLFIHPVIPHLEKYFVTAQARILEVATCCIVAKKEVPSVHNVQFQILFCIAESDLKKPVFVL